MKRKKPGDLIKGIRPRHDKARHNWRVYFNLGGERWSRGPYRDEQEAHAAAVEWQRRHLTGADIRPERAHDDDVPARLINGSVRDYGDRWIVDGQQQRARGTNAFYVTQLERHIYPALSDLPMEDLTRERVKAFAKSLVGRTVTGTRRKLRHASRKAIVLTLSSLCSWAREQTPAPFDANPVADVWKFLVDKDELPRTRVVWTHAQAEALLRVVEQRAPEWFAFLYVALRTGLRAGELIELQWAKDFDIPGQVLVQRQWVRAVRKHYTVDDGGTRHEHDTDDVERVTPTKGRQTRNVELRPDVQRVLAAHKAAQRERALKRGQPMPLLVFTTERGKRVTVTNFEKRILGPLTAAAKVPQTTSLHTTRHTFATVLLAAGEDLGWVSRQLGHASTETTERHYKHWIDDARRDKERGSRIDAAWAVD